MTDPRGNASGHGRTDDLADARRRAEARTDAATGAPWYRQEPWLALLIASLIPVILAIFVPKPFKWLFLVVGGIGFASGIGLLARQERRTRRSSTD